MEGGWVVVGNLRLCSPSIDSCSLTCSGDVEKAVTELIIDFDTNAEEEGPYEALYNAVSCHSLDSMASGRSSDRDSMNKEAEAAGVKTAGVRPVCDLGPSTDKWGLCCQPVLWWSAGRGSMHRVPASFPEACSLLPLFSWASPTSLLLFVVNLYRSP